MIEAMVTDTAAHLGNIQGKRDQLEAMIAEGKPDEEISLCTQGLVQVIKDYRVAATHVKKHTAKPKQAKEAREPDQSAEGAPGAWQFLRWCEMNLGGTLLGQKLHRCQHKHVQSLLIFFLARESMVSLGANGEPLSDFHHLAES